MTNSFGNPWLKDIERIKSGRSARYGSYRLDKNEWVGEYPELILDIVKDAMTSEIFAAYPETHILYKQLASFHKISQDSIHLTAGIDGAIKNCFEVFTQAGSEVVTISPTYAMVDVYCKLFNVRQVVIEHEYDLSLDPAKIVQKINNSTSLVIIANPNSPTGQALTVDEIFTICRKCQEYHVPILIDEAYYGFSPVSMERLLPDFGNVMIARTFSKAFGLAGFRVGYIISSSSIIQTLSKFKPMYEVTGPSVIAATAMLNHYSYVEDYCAQVCHCKSLLEERLSSRSAPFISTFTNFMHIDFGINRELVLSELSRLGFLLQGGVRMKGYENYSRVSIGTTSLMEKFWSSIEGMI